MCAPTALTADTLLTQIEANDGLCMPTTIDAGRSFLIAYLGKAIVGDTLWARLRLRCGKGWWL